jgi:hypothetical protein
MSYAQPRPGLGSLQLPGCTLSRHDDSFVEHGQTWRRIGIATEAFRALQERLGLLRFPTGLFRSDGHGENRLVGEGKGVEAGIYCAWLRFGMVHRWWVCNLTSPCDDGVRLDWGCAVRVHSDLHRAIMGLSAPPVVAGSVWHPAPDRFIRVQGGVDQTKRDGLMDMLVERLIQGGFLPALNGDETAAGVTTRLFSGNAFVGGDSGPLVSALRAAFGTLSWPGKKQDQWPSGINFGPTTNFRELRIHPEFLKALLRPMSTEAARLNSARIWRRTGTFPR